MRSETELQSFQVEGCIRPGNFLVQIKSENLDAKIIFILKKNI